MAPPELTTLFYVLPFALVVIVLALWHGVSLRRTPDRSVGLSIGDLVIGVMVSFIGVFAAQTMVVQTGILPGEIERYSARQFGILTVITQVSMFLPLVVFLVIWWQGPRQRERWAKLGIVPRDAAREVMLAVGGVAVMLALYVPVIVLSGLVARWLGQEMPEVGHILLTRMREADDPAALWLLIFGAVVVAPIVEEFIYRGFVQTAILNAMPGRGSRFRWWAVIITSALFAMIHIDAVAWHALPGLFIVGLTLGWLYERTGSLLAPVLAHAAFNGLNVTLALLTQPSPATPPVPLPPEVPAMLGML